MLVRGYPSGSLLGIRIRCFRCGAVATTPGLAEGDILPRITVAVDAIETPMVTTARIPGNRVLASRETEQASASTRPEQLPDEPHLLSRAMLEAAAADYDRLTGGRLGEHEAVSPPAEGVDQGPYPFAWSVLRLRDQIDTPGWSWLYQNDDAMAAMYVTAVHHLMLCWHRHPMLARLAAPLAEPDRFIRTVTTLAMAKLLFDAGNRVGFSFSGSEVGLRFTTAAGEPLTLALLAPDALQWRQKEHRSPDVFREAVIEAMAAAQGQVNRARPGIIVLAASILQPDFDQMVVDAVQAAFQSTGRRHRGVAAVAIVMPKVLPAGAPDRVGFGYAFYPMRNPRFLGENPIRLESA